MEDFNNIMNKKNISFILAGFLLLTLQFNVKIGSVYIDIFNDILAAVLITAGAFPLGGRNVVFKKFRILSVVSIIFIILGQVINFLMVIMGGDNALKVVSGVATIFNIYLTYYFTEGLILEAKFQDKSALTRSLRLVWALYGILIFGNFIALMSGIALVSTLVQIVCVIFSIYYCSSVSLILLSSYLHQTSVIHIGCFRKERIILVPGRFGRHRLRIDSTHCKLVGCHIGQVIFLTEIRIQVTKPEILVASSTTRPFPLRFGRKRNVQSGLLTQYLTIFHCVIIAYADNKIGRAHV